jgi:cytochrome b subunit of formate dehydrogenase
MQIWTWITSNWTEIVAAVGGIVLAARIIVKLTPSETDNVWLEKIINFLKGVGLHIK